MKSLKKLVTLAFFCLGLSSWAQSYKAPILPKIGDLKIQKHELKKHDWNDGFKVQEEAESSRNLASEKGKKQRAPSSKTDEVKSEEVKSWQWKFGDY